VRFKKREEAALNVINESIRRIPAQHYPKRHQQLRAATSKGSRKNAATKPRERPLPVRAQDQEDQSGAGQQCRLQRKHNQGNTDSFGDFHGASFPAWPRDSCAAPLESSGHQRGGPGSGMNSVSPGTVA
jgi:hypothetical protein